MFRYTVIIAIVALFTVPYSFQSSCYGQKDISETQNKEDAENIYKKHGVQEGLCSFRKKHVCGTIDGKTNRLFGDALCRRSLSKIRGGGAISERATCVEKGIAHTKAKGSQKTKVELMAKCVYGPSEFDFYLISAGPMENFYYIFEQGQMPTQCIRIELQKDDLKPIIQIAETKNIIEADDMYGIYGQLPHKHSCKNICIKPGHKSDNVTPVEWCQRGMKTMPNNENYQLKNNPVCIKRHIKRRIQDPHTKEYKVAAAIPMLKCEFEERGRQRYFMMFIGPQDQLIYFAGFVYNSDDLVEIVSCVEV